MGFDVSKLDTDPNLEEQGVWVPLDEGGYLKIARANNTVVQKEWSKVPKSERGLADRGALSSKRATELWSHLISTGIIRGWKDIYYKGQELSFTQENAYWLCQQSKGFRDFIWELANDEEIYKQGEVEADVGNSKSSSSGNSPTEG